MATVTNALVTQTEAQGLGTARVVANPVSSNKIITTGEYTQTYYYYTGGALNGYLQIPNGANRCPRYQDLTTSVVNMQITKSVVGTPSVNSDFYYQIAITQYQSYFRFDLVLLDTVPVGMILKNFAYVYINGNPVPNPTGDYYTVNSFDSNVDHGSFYITLKESLWANLVGGGSNIITIGFTARVTSQGTYTNLSSISNYLTGPSVYVMPGNNTVTVTTTCSPTPNWQNNGQYNCYGTCNLYYVQSDINPCSSTYGNQRQGGIYQSNSTSCGGCCGQSTSPNWQNNGQYNCYGTCNLYYVQADVNSCSSSYNQTRQGGLYQGNSTSCGGCCGQSTAPNWVNNGQYDCYGTSCTKYYVQVDSNPCSGSYGSTQQGGVAEDPSTYCGGCCGQGTAPNWVNVGDPTCNGCNLYQEQTDTNVCSSVYPSTQFVDLGPNSTCGSWNLEYYCDGYTKMSRERNTCTQGTRNNQVVEYNSPYCGYVPPVACRTYQIVGYNADESVNGVYTNCAGFSDSFSFFGGPGTVGYICAQTSTVYITSGNGGAVDVGGC